MKALAKNHESFLTLTIVAYLFPLVGGILAVVYLTKDKQIDRKLGEHLLVASVLAFIMWMLLLTFLNTGY